MQTANEFSQPTTDDHSTGNELAMPSSQDTGTGLRRLDLSRVVADAKSPIHALATVHLNRPEAVMTVTVFDLANVHITPEAKQAINCAYITPLFVIEAFGRYYRDQLLRELTRGNDKGLHVLDPKASRYCHRLNDGSELVVEAETVEGNGENTRSLTISLRSVNEKGEAA